MNSLLRCCGRLACVALLALWCALAAAASLGGDLAGTFQGTADDGAAYSGAIEGRWTASGTFSNTVFVENVTGSGTFGGSGIGGNWSMAGYDSATNTISVNWSAAGNRGPGKGSADGSVKLVVNPAAGVATGAFSGQIYTDKGARNVTGTWTVRFQGAAGAEVTGKIQGNFAGTATYLGNVAGSVSGNWKVRVMPDGSVVGNASGRYDGGLVSVPGYGSVCICGDFQATLNRGTDGLYSLQGSWTHPVVSGALEGSGGGPIVWYIDTSKSPMQASGQFSGASSVTVAVPIVGSISASIGTQGTWTATLPFN